MIVGIKVCGSATCRVQPHSPCPAAGAACRFVPLRYIQWTHTTPTMIMLMAMMSNTSSSGVLTAVAADLVMVVMGLAATWTTGPPQVSAGGGG